MSLDLSFGRLDFVIPSSAKLGKYRVAGMGRWGWNGWQPPPPDFGVLPRQRSREMLIAASLMNSCQSTRG